MNYRKRFLQAAALGALTAVLWAAATRPVTAQGGVPSHQAILSALTTLQDGMQSGFAALQASLNALTAPAHAHARVTPAFMVNPGGTATCQVINVSDSTRVIAIDVMRLNGDRTGGHSQPVEPGRGYLLGVTASTVERTTSYCKFSVEDGSRTDIRAAAEVFEPASTPLNAVAALLPAE